MIPSGHERDERAKEEKTNLIHALIRSVSGNLPRDLEKTEKAEKAGDRTPPLSSLAVMCLSSGAEPGEPAGDRFRRSGSDFSADVFVQEELDGAIDRHFRLRM